MIVGLALHLAGKNNNAVPAGHLRPINRQRSWSWRASPNECFTFNHYVWGIWATFGQDTIGNKFVNSCHIGNQQTRGS